jgi:hypothetical protein
MPVDRGKPTGIAVMDEWYEKAAESMISGLLVAVANNRIAWSDEPSTQVLSLGKIVLRLLSGRCPCFHLCWLVLHHSIRRQARLFAWPRPACRSRPFVRVALLLAGSWTWHCISVLALRRIHLSPEESAGDDTVVTQHVSK